MPKKTQKKQHCAKLKKKKWVSPLLSQPNYMHTRGGIMDPLETSQFIIKCSVLLDCRSGSCREIFQHAISGHMSIPLALGINSDTESLPSPEKKKGKEKKDIYKHMQHIHFFFEF